MNYLMMTNMVANLNQEPSKPVAKSKWTRADYVKATCFVLFYVVLAVVVVVYETCK